MRVRPAASGDVHELLALIRDHAAFEQSCAGIEGPEMARLLASNDPPVRLFVAPRDGHCVGYCAITFDYSLWRGCRWAHLDCLFVRAGERDRGTGRLLLARAVEEARASGADRLEWQTPDWNVGAIGFYERIGAVGRNKMRFSLAV